MSCKAFYHMLPTYSFEYKKIGGPDIDEIEPILRIWILLLSHLTSLQVRVFAMYVQLPNILCAVQKF